MNSVHIFLGGTISHGGPWEGAHYWGEVALGEFSLHTEY